MKENDDRNLFTKPYSWILCPIFIKKFKTSYNWRTLYTQMCTARLWSCPSTPSKRTSRALGWVKTRISIVLLGIGWKELRPWLASTMVSATEPAELQWLQKLVCGDQQASGRLRCQSARRSCAPQWSQKTRNSRCWSTTTALGAEWSSPVCGATNWPVPRVSTAKTTVSGTGRYPLAPVRS